MVFDSAATFKAGEVLRVIASSQISSSGGLQAAAYQWEFTVANQNAVSGDGRGTGDAWYEQHVSSSAGLPEAITPADLDGDGDLDFVVAAAGTDSITWWKNNGSQGFSRATIGSGFAGAMSVDVADLDGDGDLDVLGGAGDNGDFSWWENDDSQNFSEHIIDSGYDSAPTVKAADMDGDGDLDIPGASEWDITWWENTATAEGSQNFTMTHTITDNFWGASAVYAADMDGDGDLDILGAASNHREITWWENDENAGERTIEGNFDGARSVIAVDIDSDGDLDVLGAAYEADTIAIWYNLAAPEIAVLGNDIEISSGDTTPATADDTDFGTLTAPNTLTHTFTISNSGPDALTLGRLSLADGEYFSIIQPPATIIEPDQTTVFSITFSPSYAGMLTDTVSLVSDDLDEPLYTFVISGTGVCPVSVVYVDQSAAAGGEGTSWTNAYRGLSRGLVDANSYAAICAPVEVWVAAGTYVPGVGTDRTNTFNLTDGVQLYGGFAGNETQRSERDWETNLTILSGDNQGNDTTNANGVVMDVANIVGPNRYHVVTADGTSDPITADTVLDGFTITAGQANETSTPTTDDDGGGFYCDGSGGGECSPSLNHVTFFGNTVDSRGGAMYNYGYQGESSPMSHVTFYGNLADYSGGAMYNRGDSGISNPSLSNVLFSGNSTTFQGGGAIYNDGDDDGGQSSPSLVNVTFYGNVANTTGGAMYTIGDSGSSSPTLVNVILWENTVGGSGNQLYNFDATLAISYTLIQSDTGDIYNRGGASMTYGPGILASDPLFVNADGPDGTAGTLDDSLILNIFSPAIDAGDNDATTATTDLNGDDRFYNDTGVTDTGNGTAPLVDMGAYERQSSSCSIIYADLGATSGNNDGSSWDDAYLDLQDSLLRRSTVQLWWSWRQ